MTSLSPLQQSYERRLARVTTYLHEHLDQPLDLQQLADLACMSVYHWHRIYQGVHGESVIATVKRLRLQKAAALLLRSELRISQIAVLVGYPNLQSFTRTFSQSYGLPPARFRQQGVTMTLPTTPPELAAYPVSIREIDAIPVLQLAHRGSYMGISQSFDLLNSHAGARGWMNAETRWLGIFLDDPVVTPEAELRSFACISLPAGWQDAVEAPFTQQRLAGGKYAVLRYQGPYSAMQAVYQWFCGQWLPASGLEAADAPPFEDYLNNPRCTAPADLLTDIYLPLR